MEDPSVRTLFEKLEKKEVEERPPIREKPPEMKGIFVRVFAIFLVFGVGAAYMVNDSITGMVVVETDEWVINETISDSGSFFISADNIEEPLNWSYFQVEGTVIGGGKAEFAVETSTNYRQDMESFRKKAVQNKNLITGLVVGDSDVSCTEAAGVIVCINQSKGGEFQPRKFLYNGKGDIIGINSSDIEFIDASTELTDEEKNTILKSRRSVLDKFEQSPEFEKNLKLMKDYYYVKGVILSENEDQAEPVKKIIDESKRASFNVAYVSEDGPEEHYVYRLMVDLDHNAIVRIDRILFK